MANRAKTQTTTKFESLFDIVASVAEVLQPPERLTVAQAAEKYRYLNNAGAYIGPWMNRTVPMLVEPMNTAIAPEYHGLIYVGAAQSAKTDSLILNELVYKIKVDPMDTMLICPTNVSGRDFSMRRVDRMHEHSEDVGAMLIERADADNVFDKHYKNGMLFTIGWPTRDQLAGKPIPWMLLTDRDRMDDDIEGDGEPFDLAMKRTTTFGSYAMTICESSPSRQVDPSIKWIKKTAHEAPPAKGILSLYNRGDRRRWYWPCPHCEEYFEGNFTMLTYAKQEGMSNLEVAETVRMECPRCKWPIHPDDREEMNYWGVWVKDGQGVDKSGRVFGPAPRTKIASFWQNGVSAVFNSWKNLVVTYLDANDAYERTGDESALIKFYNNDLAEPYKSKALEHIRLPETLHARADQLQEHQYRRVPENVRFLMALVDVQKNMWVVQVFGVLPGKPFDMVLIDRYDVRKSLRTDGDGDAEWVKPHSHLDDWDQLIPHVMEREYELDDDSGRFMRVKHTACDSGGREGVTTMAYNFWRRLAADGMARRFTLTKGEAKPGEPRARVHYPDSSRKDSKAGARGDIPVLFFNTNILKDDLNGRLDCVRPGNGMIRFPNWLPDSWFMEMCAEIRTDKGWEDPTGKRRNEAWDLCYMAIGLAVSQYIGVEAIDWSNPPLWAEVWDKNSLVRKPHEVGRFVKSDEKQYDFAALGHSLA